MPHPKAIHTLILEPVTVSALPCKKHFVDANRPVDLEEMVLDYPYGPSPITRVLKSRPLV